MTDDLARIAGRIAGIPIGELDATRAMASLGERLALANLGLVRVADPARFAWPGYWLAITAEGQPVLMFGVPSGPVELGDAGTIVEGYVIAPLDLERPHGDGAYAGAVVEGVVTGLFTAPSAGAPCVAHEVCRIAGGGLEGDRYAAGTGTFSADRRGGQAVTLISEEALAQAQANGAEIDAATARRNIVTRGLELEPLIGREFAIGTAVLRGVRLAEPCAHLQRVTRPGVLRAMVHLGGIRADVVQDGDLRVGDTLRA